MLQPKLKILFLCTGNSCRSQMAEGWAHHLKSDLIEPWSAGLEKHGLNPHAVKVMAEAGVDISGQYSKTLDELSDSGYEPEGREFESRPAWPAEQASIAFRCRRRRMADSVRF